MNSMQKMGNRLYILQKNPGKNKMKRKYKEEKEADFMKNAAGREIPDAILERYKKTGYAGAYARDQQTYQKAAPAVRGFVRPGQSKLTGSIREALERCGIRDGMVLSFHHHFRDGDYVVNMVMEEVAAMGIRDITICASSLGAAHNPVADMIEQGIVTGIQSSGVRG